MKNKPNKIFLQIGEETELGFDFKELEGITFSTDKIYDSDLVYYSEEQVKKLIKKHLEIASNEAKLRLKKGRSMGFVQVVDKESITSIEIKLS